MGALDLNRVAVCMGKVIALLSKLETYIINGNDVEDHRMSFCYVAYMCRIGILDRMAKNSYMLNPLLIISIPTGFFKTRKESMDSALRLTIGKLKQMIEDDDITDNYVEDILSRKGYFYVYENSLPEQFKRKI